MNSILEIFATNVRKERRRLGISQEKLAEMANLHRTYIGSIERCEKNITIITAQKIATTLKTDLCILLKEQ